MICIGQFYCNRSFKQKQTKSFSFDKSVKRDDNEYKQKIDELKRQIQKFNVYTGQLQTENEELRYELAKLSQSQNKLNSYQQQINALNEQIEKNSQYIFDLQQKLVDYSYQFIDKERILKKQYEDLLINQKQKMQIEYINELQNNREQIKIAISEQLYHEFQSSIAKLDVQYTQQKQLLRKEIQQKSLLLTHQQQYYQNKINIIQNKNIDLLNQLKEYQLKLQQYSHNHNLFAKKQYLTRPQAILIMEDQQNISQAILSNCQLDDKSKQIPFYKINVDYNSQQMLVRKKTQPYIRQSESSFMLQQQKDNRMRNISSKLLQLRADIRKQIGTIKN